VSAVPLTKYAEFRRLTRDSARWYAEHQGWAEYSDETEILLDRSGNLYPVRGSLLYRLEQRNRCWRVACIDSETDPDMIDTEELRDAWEERGQLAVEILAGGHVITIAMREEAEREGQE